MTFPDFLRSQILRIGEGVASRGEPLVAIALGYSPRKVRMWAAGQPPHPTPAEQAGARVILPQCGTIADRDKRLRKRKAKP